MEKKYKQMMIWWLGVYYGESGIKIIPLTQGVHILVEESTWLKNS